MFYIMLRYFEVAKNLQLMLGFFERGFLHVYKKLFIIVIVIITMFFSLFKLNISVHCFPFYYLSFYLEISVSKKTTKIIQRFLYFLLRLPKWKYSAMFALTFIHSFIFFFSLFSTHTYFLYLQCLRINCRYDVSLPLNTYICIFQNIGTFLV